jgi:hypothetical protein
MIDLIKIVSGFLVEILILFFIYLSLRPGGSVKVFLKYLVPQIVGASIVFVGIRKGILWLIYLGNILIIADVTYIAITSLLSQIKKDLPSTINKIFLIVLAPLQTMIRLNTLIVWLTLASLMSQKHFPIYLMALFALDVIALAVVSIIKININDMEYLKIKLRKSDTAFNRVATKISYTLMLAALIAFMGCVLWSLADISIYQ